MTTFAELKDLTMVLTQRPELGTLTESAVRTAVLRAHHTDFFRRDLAMYQHQYTLSDSAAFYSFPDISVMLSRLRAVKKVYGCASDWTLTEELEYRETDDLYDEDGNRRCFAYTIIGDTLQAYFSCPSGYMQFIYFQNPVTSTIGFNSWIADMYPDDVAGWAAAIVMARTGFLELANQYQKQYIEPLKEQLVATHLLGTVS